jgi:multisubunit Na+/H+ antiporter MnhC subunit
VTTTKPATPYRWAALVGLAVFGIYLVTLAPTTAFWDTSEYIAAARVLGIPHPPGNPLFVVLAHTWGLLPLAGEYARRINLFAAVSSAASAALWFLIAEGWLRSIVPVRWGRLLAAAAGTLVSATSWTVWNQSTVNEKVYTVSLLSMALVTWLAVHWGDDDPGPHRDRWVVLIAYIIALSTTNHLMGLLAAPAVAIYILWTDWRVATRPWVWAGVLTAIVVGVSLNFLFLPIRAGQFPPINEGEPVGFFSSALMDVINRVQYAKPPVLDRQADLLSQFANYFQYVRWQYARDWGAASGALAALFGMIGLYGLAELLRRDRRAGLAALAMFGTLTVALIFYLNFKYGFSIHPERDLPREVRERDYFFVGSFAYFGVLVALGLGALYRGVADALSPRLPEARRWAFAAPIFLVALIPLAGNHASATRAHEFLARDLAVDMLESVEPYGILITAGDNDTFPLWFAQEVLGVRPDVTLANLSLMNTRWHLRQLQRRETPEFDAARAAPVWRLGPAGTGLALTDSATERPATAWPRPQGSVLRSFTTGQLDSLPEAIAVKKNSGIRVDSLVMAFGRDYLSLQDIATVAMIRDNLGKRPIYFSWSDGNYADATLGLTGYLLTTGLVRKLMPNPVREGNGVVLSPTLGYVDLPLTRKLLWDTYHWQSATQARARGWVDVPSSSILQLYGIIYRESGVLLARAGQADEAARADSIAVAVQQNIMRGERN